MSPKFVTLLLFVMKISADPLQINTLIQRIHEEHSIQTVCFIGNPSENEFILRRLDFPKLIYTPSWKNGSHTPKMDKNVLLLVIVPLNAEHTLFEAMKQLIESMMKRKFVIIHTDSLVDLQTCFNWFWDNKFTRIFGRSGEKSYAFLPYADVKIHELTDDGPLPDALRDLNGYAIRTTVYQDPPRVFPYTDKKGNHKIGGSAAQIFFGFLQKHNASYTDVILNNSKHFYLPDLRKALLDGSLDISMSTYTFAPRLRLSYPVRFMRWDILVPYNGYISANEYFIRPFKTSAWLAIILMGIYIATMGVLCDYIIIRRLRVWETFSRIICIALCISTEHRIRNAYRFYILVHVFAFILSNLYIIHLTSFLTVFIESKQVDSMQDIIDKHLQVIVGTYERKYILRTFHVPPGFENVLIGFNLDDITNIMNMNNTVGIVFSGERAEFILSQQAYLKQPHLHKCKEFLTKMFTGFLLHPQSPFGDSVDMYIVEIHQSGLMAKWISDVVHQGREAGILNTFRDEGDPRNPLTLHHFAFAWNCYAVGMFLGLIVFLGEKVKKWCYRV